MRANLENPGTKTRAIRTGYCRGEGCLSVLLSFSYIIEEPPSDGSMQRRRCGVCDHEDELPHHLCCRPNDRVYVEVRDGEENSSSPLSVPRLFSPIAVHFVAVFRRTLRAALGTPLWNLVARQSSQNLGNRRVRASLFGEPSVTIEHESIRHEVLTAATTTATEAEKVGE